MTEENKNENQEEIMKISEEQLQAMLGGNSESDKLPPIEIDMEDYNLDEFKRGIHETSYISGVITALLNTGLSESTVLDYLLNKETIAYNLKAAEINKDMNITVAKNQRVSIDKQEL